MIAEYLLISLICVITLSASLFGGVMGYINNKQCSQAKERIVILEFNLSIISNQLLSERELNDKITQSINDLTKENRELRRYISHGGRVLRAIQSQLVGLTIPDNTLNEIKEFLELTNHISEGKQ